MRPGSSVAVVNLDDQTFIKLLHERTSDVVVGRPRAPCDLVFIGAEQPADLARIAQLKASIKPDGAIWVVRPKGGSSSLRETDVIDAALAAGLVDNKIASFSANQGAMRLVYRLRDRPRAGRPQGKHKS